MKKFDKQLNLHYYTHRYKNGLKAIFIPLDNKVSTSVAIEIDVGNKHLYYKDRELLPGTAHFLEHLIFKEEDGIDGFVKITKLTSNANAYTSLDKTVYHYDILGDDLAPLETYLSVLDNPYIKDEDVEKERDIIVEEVKQSDNSPFGTIYRLSDDATYQVHPDKHSIGGTVEDVLNITKDDILFLYNNMYNNSNRTIVVSGNFDYNKYHNFLKSYDASRAKDKHLKHRTKKEGVRVVNKYLEVSSNYSSDYVAITYKFYKSKDIKEYSEQMRRIFVNDIFFSQTSPFHEHMRKLKLFNSALRVNLKQTKHLERLRIVANTNDRDRFIKEVDDYLFNNLDNDFDEELFRSLKRSQIGQMLLGVDVANFLVGAVQFSEKHKIDVKTHLDGIREMTKENILNYFNNMKKTNKSVVVLKKSK